MIGNTDLHLADVVRVVRLEETMTEPSGRIEESARIALTWLVRGIHFDADDVIAGRDDGLAIRAVQHEVLAAEPFHIGIAVIHADTLIAGNLWQSEIGACGAAAGP